MIDQPTALVVNPPPVFSAGNHSSHSANLGLAVLGGVYLATYPEKWFGMHLL